MKPVSSIHSSSESKRESKGQTVLQSATVFVLQNQLSPAEMEAEGRGMGE